MIETISTCQRRISDNIPAHEVETTVRKIVSENKQAKPLKGFRPGSKKTLDFLSKQFTNYPQICYMHLSKILQENDLKPVSRPQFKKVDKMPDGTLSYIAEFEINPSISTINWDKDTTLENLAIELPAQDSITETDVEALIVNMTPVINQANQKNPDSKTPIPDKTKMYQELQEGISRNIQSLQKEHLSKQAIETLLAQNPLPEIPESLVQVHYQSLKKREQQVDDAQTDTTLLEQARRKVKMDLLIDAYKKLHKIELDQNKLKAKLALLNNLMTQEVQAGKSSQSELNRILKDRTFMYNLFNEILEEQVVEHLIQSAQLKEKPIPYSEAMGLDHTLKEAFTKEIEKFSNLKNQITQEEATS